MLGGLPENGSGGGIYWDSKCGFQGEGMPYFWRKEVHLSSIPVGSQRFYPESLPYRRQNLFNCQRAILMEKGRHLVEPGHSN